MSGCFTRFFCATCDCTRDEGQFHRNTSISRAMGQHKACGTSTDSVSNGGVWFLPCPASTYAMSHVCKPPSSKCRYVATTHVLSYGTLDKAQVRSAGCLSIDCGQSMSLNCLCRKTASIHIPASLFAFIRMRQPRSSQRSRSLFQHSPAPNMRIDGQV